MKPIESTPTNEKNADNKPTLQEEINIYQSSCEEHQTTQSSKVSATSRTIIYGIIGAIWAILLMDRKTFKDLHPLLVVSIVMCFVYLLLDISHYFIDACRYRIESFRLDSNILDDEYKLKRCKGNMDNIAFFSFCAVVGKYILTIITSIIFIFGLLGNLNK